jgi:SAM-dependent methyltransferase
MFKWKFFNKKDPQRTSFKHYKISRLAKGKILDIGYAQHPNKLLHKPIGIDVVKRSPPENYEAVYSVNLNHDPLPFPENTFDSVIAADVIEHVENPSFLLRECNRVLKSDGKLILSTPHATHWMVVLRNMFFKNAPYWDTKGEHLSNWDMITMKVLLKKNGFDLKQIHGICMKFPGGSFAIPCGKFYSLSWILIYECLKIDAPDTNIYMMGLDEQVLVNSR